MLKKYSNCAENLSIYINERHKSHKGTKQERDEDVRLISTYFISEL